MEKSPSQKAYESGKKEFSTGFLAEKSDLLESKNDEEKKALLIRLKREAEIIYDEALRYFADLQKSEVSGPESETQPNLQITLVQLPESRAKEVTERIVEAERNYSPELTEKGYITGTATKPNDIKLIEGSKPVLFTAEHATDQLRDGKTKSADWGTGGFTEVLATDHGTFAITALGEQTGDPNHDDTHEFKSQAGLLIVQKNMQLALSIHGIGGKKFMTEPQKDLGISSDIAIGIGRKHTVESQEFAEWLQALAADYDLRADINPWYLALDSNDVTRKKDSLPLRNSFRADKEYTTRSHYQSAATEAGLMLPIAQLEFGPDLRVGPNTKQLNPEKIYKAYLLLTQAIAKFS